jgi:hypothetical protein
MKNIISNRIGLLTLFFPFWVLANPIPIIVPPQNWECVHPQKLSSEIQIAFLGKGASDFRPSLNLAVEEIDVPLDVYIKSVRRIHESEMNMKWRDLGPFTFNSGKGRLAEISGSSPMGEVKMLQGIYVQDRFAYIVTGAVLKDEFASQQKTVLNAIRSLTIAPDLFSTIADASQRSSLQDCFRSFSHLTSPEERQNEWSHLQNVILKDFSSMGAHWQILILKEGYQQIFNNKNSK